MFERLKPLVARTHFPAWALMVILLPLTSLPLLANLVRTDTIAAPSALPALWLLFTWLIPHILRGGKLPGQVVPFLGVVLVQIIASARSFFIEVPSFRAASQSGEMGDAFITLLVGSAFYLLAATWIRDRDRLRGTLRLINWSGVLLVGWAMVQAFYVAFFRGQYPDWVLLLQSWVSTRKLFFTRISGFAFEPSWLAHQLNMVYLPFWLAASLQRFSVFRLRIWKFSPENLLLVGGVLALIFSVSRVGWLAFLLIATVLLVSWSIDLAQWLHGRILNRVSAPPFWRGAIKTGTSLGLFAVFLAVYVGGGLGLLRLAGELDGRLYGFFDRLQDVQGFYELSNRLVFAERAVYWGTGWEIFNDHPLLGVGLGNAGFFFQEKMPAFGWFLDEIMDLFNRRSFIPNTKSIWTRFLADTGIVGFSFFISWLYVLWQSARSTYTSPDRLLKTMGMMGIFILLGLLIEGFSVDSFALPYMWFALGLLTSGAALFSRIPDSEEGV